MALQEYVTGKNADHPGTHWIETIHYIIPENLKSGMKVQVKLDARKTFQIVMRFDTEVEFIYFLNPGAF